MIVDKDFLYFKLKNFDRTLFDELQNIDASSTYTVAMSIKDVGKLKYTYTNYIYTTGIPNNEDMRQLTKLTFDSDITLVCFLTYLKL